MDLAFAPGDRVKVDDLNNDRDTAMVNGVRVNQLKPEGEVVEARAHPPEMTDDHDGENPSPHYLVRLKHPDGGEHEVWFTEPRLRAETDGSSTKKRG